MAANALCLPEEVVTRLRDNETIFQCPVCLERVYSPIIFSLCGHSVCLVCFRKMCSTTALEGASTEVPVGFRCHSCCMTINLQKVTDYSSFVLSYNFLSSNQGSSTLFPLLLKALLGLNNECDKDDEDSSSGMDIGLEACRTDHIIPPLQYRVALSEISSASKQSSAAMRKQV